MMLTEIQHRKGEIGLRLALGASRKDIGAIFTLEAVLLSFVASLAGVAVGILLYITLLPYTTPLRSTLHQLEILSLLLFLLLRLLLLHKLLCIGMIIKVLREHHGIERKANHEAR